MRLWPSRPTKYGYVTGPGMCKTRHKPCREHPPGGAMPCKAADKRLDPKEKAGELALSGFLCDPGDRVDQGLAVTAEKEAVTAEPLVGVRVSVQVFTVPAVAEKVPAAEYEPPPVG